MSYFGASGTKHTYIATDQPLYGLNGLGSLGTEAAPSPYVPPGIQMANQDARATKAVQAIERVLVDSTVSLQSGVICPNRSPSSPFTSAPAGDLMKQWAMEGFFVVIMLKAGACAIMGTAGIAEASVYKFPASSISAILNDPSAFVVYLPQMQASTDLAWGKYKQELATPAVAVVNPVVQPVKTDLPATLPPASAEAGMSGPVKLLLALGLGYVVYRLAKGSSYAQNEYEDIDFLGRVAVGLPHARSTRRPQVQAREPHRRDRGEGGPVRHQLRQGGDDPVHRGVQRRPCSLAQGLHAGGGAQDQAGDAVRPPV